MPDPTDLHPLWLGQTPLILASGSRTRFDLLASAGIPVRVIKPGIDERAITETLEMRSVSPETIAVSLAGAKALPIAKNNPGRFVLGADQTLSCNGMMLHKPKDRQQAAEQLAFLSDQTHQLISGVTIALDQQIVASFAGLAKLTLRKLSSEMIERYLDAAGDAVMESVGGYQLEKIGIHLFKRIAGDQSTILGLPMLETLNALRRLGLVAT